MEAQAASANWGDPYIGLRHTAVEIRAMALSLVRRPGLALYPEQTPWGSPSIWDDLKELWNSFIKWISRLWEGYWAGIFWTWLKAFALDPVTSWLRAHLFEKLQAWVEDKLPIVRDWVSARWTELITPFVARYNSIKSALENWLEYFKNQFYSAIVAIKQGIGDTYTWFKDTLKGIVERIRDALEQKLGVLKTTVLGIPETLGDVVRRLREAIENHLRLFWETLGGYYNTIKTALVGAISGAWTAIAQPLNSLWERLYFGIKNLGSYIGSGVTSAWTALWNIVTTAIREIWSGITSLVMRAAETVMSPIRDRVREWFGNFITIPATFLEWVATTAGTNLALEPSRALTTAGALYIMSIAAGTSAHVLSTALNAIPATNWVGASQLSAFVAEAAAFAPLTNATYGVLINDALTQPMRYYWNQKLRPRIPSEGSIYAMGRKRGLTRSEFGEAMAYQGLPDSWIDKEYSFFWADPSPYWLLRMSENATPTMSPSAPMLKWLAQWLPNWRADPWAWYKMKLMLAGFEDTDIQPFIDGFTRRRVGPATTQLKTAVRGMFREGYWTQADVEALLLPLGVRQEEIWFMCRSEQLRFQKAYLDDQVKYFSEAFRKGELSRQDLSLSLSTFIANSSLVAQIVSREVVRALPKPKSVVAPKDDPLVVTLRRQAINSWTAAYRDWAIDQHDLLLGLTIVVQDVALANTMVAVEQARYRPPPPLPPPPAEDPIVAKSRRDAIASWVKQFRDGEITAAVMEMGLANLISDPALVTQIRQLEELRARPAPDILPPWEEDPAVAAVREEHVRAHIEMFRKRLIDVRQLYVMLVADGLAEALARATAVTQALKRVKVPPLESPYFQRDYLQSLMDEAMSSYSRMLQLGEISQEQYEAYLAGVGVDAAVISYLGDTEALRSFLAAFPL